MYYENLGYPLVVYWDADWLNRAVVETNYRLNKLKLTLIGE